MTDTVSVLETSMNQIITTALNGVDSTIDFLSSEIPDVIEQLLMWNFGRSLFEVGVAMMVLLVVFILNRHWRIDKWIQQEQEKDDCNPWFLIHCWHGIWMVTFGTYFNITWLQIWIAPKVWLIEYAATLTQKVAG